MAVSSSADLFPTPWRMFNPALFRFSLSFRSAARRLSDAFGSLAIAQAITASPAASSWTSRLTEILPVKVNSAFNPIGRRIALGLSLFTLLGLTSCHYRFGQGELSQCYETLSVPYAEGDEKGDLTAEVIKKLSASGAFRYAPLGRGELTLTIKLVDYSDHNIDFRYDRTNKGKRKKSIVPTATRLTATAEIALVETATGRVIRGPTRVLAGTEFDHTYYATRNEINVFSLGQLTDVDAAREAARHPLNASLAERIVDCVVNSW